MKYEMTALPVYQDRISPLLDVAKKFVVYEIENDEIMQKITLKINTDDESASIDRLKDISVDTIICGAVSDFMSGIIHERGIKLISWITGPVDDTIDLYIKGTLIASQAGPYKCGRKRRRRQCNTGSINRN